MADGKGIEVDTNEHPETTKLVLSVGTNAKVTISHGGYCLEGPIEGIEVLVSDGLIDYTSGSNPCVVQAVFESGSQIPEASHKMNKE